MRAPTANPITQGEHLASRAVDHAYLPDDSVYAPEDGVIESYQQRGSGTSDAGNCLRLRGATGLHQFAHLYQSYVSVGQQVRKGQCLAQMGDTGYAFGRHLHYWIQRPDGSYTYPPTLYTEPFNSTQGDTIMNRDEEANAYQIVLGRPMEHGGSGRTGYKFIVDAKAEVDAQRANQQTQLQNIQRLVNEQNQAIADLTNKNALTEAEKAAILAQIADCNAEIATAHDTITDLEKTQGGFTQADRDSQNNILLMVTTIYEYFHGQYRTFLKYVKK